MRFKHLKSGIIQLIVNTQERWVDYQTLVTFKRDTDGKPIPKQQFTIELLNTGYGGEWCVTETLSIDFDFDHRKYHKLEQQEKDQIVIYFVPKEMLL
ncbi:hypothetical protein [Aeromonas phage 4L372D]|uniref:Uncharacterized protein n=1 Tax=Aeromonas phage 4L372D TaxID=2588518 RepID=A0A5B9N7B5_9CAUD|nr:hypothetical protein HWC27_gp052 [Aeromonas phage 4L372D]QEG08516.1 hypothetical protein [Aeromonas phage 4L372D]